MSYIGKVFAGICIAGSLFGSCRSSGADLEALVQKNQRTAALNQDSSVGAISREGVNKPHVFWGKYLGNRKADGPGEPNIGILGLVITYPHGLHPSREGSPEAPKAPLTDKELVYSSVFKQLEGKLHLSPDIMISQEPGDYEFEVKLPEFAKARQVRVIGTAKNPGELEEHILTYGASLDEPIRLTHTYRLGEHAGIQKAREYYVSLSLAEFFSLYYNAPLDTVQISISYSRKTIADGKKERRMQWEMQIQIDGFSLEKE